MSHSTRNFLPRIAAVLVFGGLAMSALDRPVCNAPTPVDDRSVDQRDRVRLVGAHAAACPSLSRAVIDAALK